jgi:DNA-binding PadR family transcriptional regulator
VSDPVRWTDLSAFQRDLLESIRILKLRNETCYGLAIKEELDDRYGKKVNHGRLYPNLNELVEAGLVKKDALDERTNRYLLTRAGLALLEDRARTLEHLAGEARVATDGGASL